MSILLPMIRLAIKGYKLRIVILLILNFLFVTAHALTPTDQKYCAIPKQIKPNMSIGDVFLILGPPHSFGQPPNLNARSLSGAPKPNVAPQSSISSDTPETRQRILASMATDPILGAFINAPADSQNVLIWNFENNTLNVSVKVKGPTVTDVKTNFTCP